MGYRTPNIDRIAREGMMFTDYYGEQSCTAGRSSFITGQSVFRTGLSKVGMPGAELGVSGEDPTIAEILKPMGYATGQFGKNHLGDKDEHLPTNHGFDEFLGNLYHLNAEEEPEHPDYPDSPGFKGRFGPRGVIHSYADGRIEDTGPLTKKRMETIDDETCGRAIPGRVPAGTVTNEIMAHMDWLPTFAAVAGDGEIKDKLLAGHQAGSKRYKVHLDGYNQLPLLTGEGPSGREELFYFSDDGESLHADRSEARLRVAGLELARSRPDAAGAALRQALRREPASVPARVNLADLARARGDEAGAERWLREALAGAPDDAGVHHALGLLAVRTGRPEEALTHLERAAALRPEEPRYAYVLAVALWSGGQRADALATLERARARHPHDGALRELAEAYGQEEVR